MAISSSTRDSVQTSLGTTEGNEVLTVLNQFIPGVQTVTGIEAASASNTGYIAYVSNGAAGSPILAFSDGSNWKRSDTGATITAS